MSSSLCFDDRVLQKLSHKDATAVAGLALGLRASPSVAVIETIKLPAVAGLTTRWSIGPTSAAASSPSSIALYKFYLGGPPPELDVLDVLACEPGEPIPHGGIVRVAVTPAQRVWVLTADGALAHVAHWGTYMLDDENAAGAKRVVATATDWFQFAAPGVDDYSLDGSDDWIVAMCNVEGAAAVMACNGPASTPSRFRVGGARRHGAPYPSSRQPVVRVVGGAMAVCGTETLAPDEVRLYSADGCAVWTTHLLGTDLSAALVLVDPVLKLLCVVARSADTVLQFPPCAHVHTAYALDAQGVPYQGFPVRREPDAGSFGVSGGRWDAPACRLAVLAYSEPDSAQAAPVYKSPA